VIQKIVDTLYRNPRGKWNHWQRFGGYVDYQKMLSAQKEMEKAAKNLYVNYKHSLLPELKVCFLTGNKFWYQTLFCAYSLQKVTPNPIHFTFYDDGTLDLIANIKDQIPNSTAIYTSEIENRLNTYLPAEKYPYLHHKRKVYKHIRKLTDVYVGTKGWKLMLDSDMLFTHTPTEMVDWLLNPTIPLYMQETESAYGFPKDYMEVLTKTTIWDCINVGCLGLNNEIIDWDKLEYWAKNLEEKFGTSYYLEQGLSAMILGNKACLQLDKERYVVYPNANVVYPNAKLFHYVDLSKAEYFRNAWKSII